MTWEEISKELFEKRTAKRFTEVYPNIIESSCHFRDNGKGITHKEVVELLNEQHETIIKKDELLSKVLSVNSNYEQCLKEIDDVLAKHNIHTLEKLDQVLTNERTW